MSFMKVAEGWRNFAVRENESACTRDLLKGVNSLTLKFAAVKLICQLTETLPCDFRSDESGQAVPSS